MKNRITPAIIMLVLLGSSPLWGENYTLNGNMESSIRYELREQVAAHEGINIITMSFVVPQSFMSPTYSQEIEDFRVVFNPEPQEREERKDKHGNRVITVTWSRVPTMVDVRLSCRAKSRTHLKITETGAPFPSRYVGNDFADYLQNTEQVQANDPRIKKLASELTRGVKTQYDAVQRIVSWVVDNVRYVSPPVRYDAVYSLESGQGNCQNYSHLSAALLRSVGIPTRIVVGVTLNEPYNIVWQRGVMTFKMGQGRHSWIEVWFPDLGWVPFDPQNSVLFIANRFIRIEVGTDNNETKNDGLMRWTQLPDARRPALQEVISASFATDQVNIKGIRESFGPKNLLLTPKVKAQFEQIAIKPPPPLPPPPKDTGKLRFNVPFLYGNLDYPENIDFAFPR